MFQSIWEDLKLAFRQGNMVIRLILINVAVFIIMALLPIFLNMIYGLENEALIEIQKFFSINADWKFNLTHPWVIFTHMFLHAGFWHLFWNMVLLYWFGRITGDLLGDRHILPLYLIGGLVGGLIYFLSANLMPDAYMIGTYALGASAAVMAIVVAAGVTAPEYMLHLILIGPVRLKFIVGILILVDVIGLGSVGGNTGGNFAHLGGALLGYFYIYQLRTTGSDWSIPVNVFFDSITGLFKGKGAKIRNMNTGGREYQTAEKRTSSKKGSASSKASQGAPSHQEQLDAILDKIKDQGYDSLSSEEKEFLFNASKN